MSTFDTNVENYSISELMAIAEINDLNPNEIIKKTNIAIKKFERTKPDISVFFRNIQSQLLQYSQNLINKDGDSDNDMNSDSDGDEKVIVESFGNMSNEAVYPAGNKQVTQWYENENLTQSDENQVNKITDRKQKISVFGNQHDPMNREQLATTDTYQLPVKQDSLNPNLKNTITRFVNLDSQFRQYTSGIDSMSTDYTLDLSDTLKNALSLRVYSYQIPFSWYAIDTAYGNTCLWIVDGSYNIPISIPPGNYSQTSFITQINASFANAGFTFSNINPPFSPISPQPLLSINLPVYYNSNNGMVTMYLNDGSFNDPKCIIPSFTITNSTKIVFYDFTGSLHCTNNCLSKTNSYFNNSLGWLMGYRLPYFPVSSNGNSGTAILDLNGPKYLILVIDDYNQNHVNNSLVSITQLSTTLKVPSYYSQDLPYICNTPSQQGNNLSELISGLVDESLFDNQLTNINGLLIGGKYQEDYVTTQTVLPSAPRILTQSQIYTINEINKNRNNNTNYLSKAPTSSDILAVLPIKTSTGVPTGTLLVDFSGSLQDNVRTYFGPVNIDRMCIKLLDDKGNVLNLNGNDWCVTLVCECLYQY
uniref:Uncharacterized protein n=1 Tax=viral metagenome TaxID=1070528 RepID=A0A6C0ERL7_9ZZZZ